jgi:hypothetical protein
MPLCQQPNCGNEAVYESIGFRSKLTIEGYPIARKRSFVCGDCVQYAALPPGETTHLYLAELPEGFEKSGEKK